MTHFDASPKRAAEIQQIAGCLRQVPVEGIARYSVIDQATGLQVQTDAYPSLAKARKMVEREDGIRFETVRNVGIKRLPAEAIPHIAGSQRRRIIRIAHRTVLRLTDVREEGLTSAIQNRLDAAKSHMGAIALCSKIAKAKKVSEAVQKAGGELSAVKAGLAMFGGD